MEEYLVKLRYLIILKINISYLVLCNEKVEKYFSINVQAVCDYPGLFLDVECRWPGCVGHTKMFTNSGIERKLTGLT